MKFAKAERNQIVVINRKRLYTTDGRTDRQAGAKQYKPCSWKGHNNGWEFNTQLVTCEDILSRR